MKSMIVLTLATAALLLAVSGCSKKEKPAQPAQGGSPAMKQTVVQVPDVIKGKWKAVTLSAYDKKKQTEATYTIDIGATFTFPDSDFSVKVENFFPNFIMEGIKLTSASNELKNPAAELRVFKGSSEVAKGWLFSRYPATAAFQKLDYTLKLVSVVKVE